jgi:hypothetical protein
MYGASIETTLGLWASSLRDVKARMRPLFGDVRLASSANQFLDKLLSQERRKTGWMRAEAAGHPGPWRQHADSDATGHHFRSITGGFGPQSLGRRGVGRHCARPCRAKLG